MMDETRRRHDVQTSDERQELMSWFVLDFWSFWVVRFDLGKDCMTRVVMRVDCDGGSEDCL